MSQPDDAALDRVGRLRRHRGLALDDLVARLSEALEGAGQVRTLDAEIDHAFGVAGMAPATEPDAFRDKAADLIGEVILWLTPPTDGGPEIRAEWQQQIDKLSRAAQLLALTISEA